MSRICDKTVLEGNGLLRILGKRGRGAVIEVLLKAEEPLTIREIARRSDVAPGVVSRAVSELDGVLAVETARPGRDMAVSWRHDTRAGHFVATFRPPDLPMEAASIAQKTVTLEMALVRDGDAELWIVADEEDEAWIQSEQILDAWQHAGLPALTIHVFGRELFDDTVLAGRFRRGILAPSTDQYDAQRRAQDDRNKPHGAK